MGWERELRDKSPSRLSQPAVDAKPAALGRWKRVTICKGPRSVSVALDTMVHKVHRNLLRAVTQWDFLSAEEEERLPRVAWQRRNSSDPRWPQHIAGVQSLESEGPKALG